MTNIQKFTLGIIFTIFSISMLGCSDSKTTVSPTPQTIQISSASNFNFGSVTENSIASPLEVIITNIGSEELNVSKIFILDTGNFKLNPNSGTNYCNTTNQRLFTDESCTIEITFNPAEFTTPPTELTTTLTINSNDPNNAIEILNIAGTSAKVSELNVTINQVDTATCNAVANVSVTDQENFPVEVLKTADFTITESAGTGVNTPTSSTLGNVTEPISIAIVMDNSSSMSDTDIDAMNQAALGVIDQLNPITDHAEIIKFDATILLKQTFTNDKDLLRTAINTQFDGSGTALYDTLLVAISDTAATSGRQAIIVITDGANSTQTNATVNDIINDAQATGIPIYVIALGNIDPKDITDVMGPIATDTSGQLYEADVAQNFTTIIEQKLTKVLFTEYILKYASGTTGIGGNINLTIDVSTGGLSGSDSTQVPSCP